jgi:DNA modification methylase
MEKDGNTPPGDGVLACPGGLVEEGAVQSRQLRGRSKRARSTAARAAGRLTRSLRRGVGLRHIEPHDNPKIVAANLRATGADRANEPPHGDDGLAARIGDDLQAAIRPQAIEEVPIETLKTNPRNARKHSQKQIEQIAASFRRFGFNGVIVVDEHNNVLAGHARLAAAKLRGMPTVPCIRVHHLDETAKRAYALADNRLPELSSWDDEVLKRELAELEALDTDFDIDDIGFDTVDLDRLLGPEPDPRGPRIDENGVSLDPDDRIPLLDQRHPAVSRLGDVWSLAQHQVLCGNALDQDDYLRLLGDERVTQVIADGPYNVRISGNVSSKKGFREFQMASGEMSRENFTTFLARWLALAVRFAVNGTILYVFMDWRHMEEVLAAVRSVGLIVKNLCVWAKPHAGMGSFYRSQHELVFVLKWGDDPHINNFGLGGRGRNRTNLWRYPSVNGPRRGVSDPDGGHPTPKSVSCLIDAIKDCSRRGDIILDPFGGSGTTLIAAERVGRRARLIEIDPHYVDLIIRRWQVVTGGAARLAGDDRTFDEVASERHSSKADVDVTNGGTNEQDPPST